MTDRIFLRTYEATDRRVGSPLDPPHQPWVATLDQGAGHRGFRWHSFHFATRAERDAFIDWAEQQPGDVGSFDLYGQWRGLA